MIVRIGHHVVMSSETLIRLLPLNVANKIAAGEVVERPASVVKELIENSLDAGATRIEVVITAGGRKLISVSDDGDGMVRDDAMMAIEPQATSKIRDVDDIERIATYGFRGEALASIAAVSRFCLRTCRRDESVGTEVAVTGGRLQDVRDIGFPAGTTVEVRDLFFNVPARRKFLRAFQTEQAHIRTAFLLQALAHPETGMRLQADGRDLHQLPPNATLRERVSDLFGAEFLDALREVDHEHGGVRISGFIGLPTLTRADRGEQYIFINRRAASAPVIPYALREAYPPLESGRRPVALLFLDVAPEDVDVNVHPTKREVRFRRSSAVRDAVMAAVSGALGIASSRPGTRPSPPSGREPDQNTTPPTPAAPPAAFVDHPLPIGAVPRYTGGTGSSPSESDRPPAPEADGTMGFDPQKNPSTPWAWCRVLGQVGGLYVLLETNDGYVVMDPRAAHERVIYERLMAAVEAERNVATQPLLIPETVKLPPADAALLHRHLDLLRAMGFGLDEFGADCFIVETMPSGLDLADARAMLTDLAHGIETAGPKRSAGRWREQAVARAASRAAVRHTRPLNPEAIAALVRDLAATRMPYTCPRGRPTMLLTPLRELARKFGRE